MTKPKASGRILVADDDRTIRSNLALLLRSEGYEIVEAVDGNEASAMLASPRIDLALLDLKMPGKSGIDVLRECEDQLENTPVIVITAYGGSQAAIEAMKLGAFDYITKPFDLDEVLFSVQRALKQQSLIAQVRALEGEKRQAPQPSADSFLGTTPAMLQIFKTIGRLAKTRETVLILGESGTGKELVATAIHESSDRVDGPFIKVNCAALSPTLLESELFGHERGAFTGAISQRIGRFEQAHGGTLFLDEIGDLDIELQAKLLRVLQTGELERVGGSESIRADVRVLSATNQNVEAMIREKRFREDLLYRLNVVTIQLPPLRERHDDIPILAEYFVRELAQKYDWRDLVLSPDAIDWLRAQPWPGNVRQLQNVIARAATVARGRLILADDLRSFAASPAVPGAEGVSREAGAPLLLKEILAETEKRFIIQALQQSSWNRTQAAQALGISRRQLFDKIRQYGLEESGQ